MHELTIHDRSAALMLVRGLAAGGVSMAFGLDDPRGYFAALRQSSIGAAVVHDERAGGFMADGYSRATGRPVACSGISGPGAVNLAPALLEAWASSVPLVAVIGEFVAPRTGLRAFQEAAHASFLGHGLTKATVEARRADELYDAAERAARLATSARARPVLLLVSDAVLWEDGANSEGAAPAPESQRPAPASPPIRRRSRPRAGTSRSTPPGHPGGERRACRRRASRALGGRRALWRARGDLDERKGRDRRDARPGARVTGSYTSGVGGRGALGLQCLREADVVLVVGSDLDALTTVDWSWPAERALLIRVEVDAAELGGIAGLDLHGDARLVLQQILAEAPVRLGDDRRTWLNQLAAEQQRAADRLAADDRAQSADAAVWPGAVMREIEEHLALDDWVVADASYSSAWALDRILQRRGGRQVLAPRGVGTLGWALPAGMGVALAAPDSRVTVVTGDGALFYGLAEMETAARWELGINVVLFRNGVYGSQRQSNLLAQGRDYEDLHFGQGLDHCALARSMGWQAAGALTVTEFSDAYREALSEPVPWLIEVAVDPDARPPLTKFDQEVLWPQNSPP